jgi:predicted nucleotidyltransferase
MSQASTLPRPLRSALQQYAARLGERFGPRLRHVYLFGSWARGQAGPDSDVDVAVVVDDLTRAEWGQAIDDACDVEEATGVTLSPFVLSGARFDFLLARERRVARDILAEGIRL